MLPIAPRVAMTTIVANPGGGTIMTSEKKDAQAAQPASEHSARQIASDLTGLPFAPLVGRTLVDTLVFTPRVARDVIAGTQAYFSPLRLFLSLMGALIAVAALFGLPTVFSMDALLTREAQGGLDAFLSENGTTRLAVVTTLDRWSGILNWPIMAIGALPYILVLKAFRPSIGWWQHTQIYLIANNVMAIVTLVALPTILAGEAVFSVATTLTLVVFFVALARIGAGAYALKWPAVAGLTLANIAISIPAMALYVVLALFGVHVVLELSFGISLLDMLALNLETDTPTEMPGD